MSARTAALVAAALCLATIAGCGDDAQGDDAGAGDVVDAIQARQVDRIEAAIDEGRLPPVARDIVNPDGTIMVDFVDGGTYDQDVVRTRDGGNRGPKLRWDFDGDGKILGEEREVTERELYERVLAVAPPVE